MNTTQDNEEKSNTGESEKSPRTQVDKLRLELKAASARVRTEEKTRLKLEEALAQAQTEAQEAQADAELERQLRRQAEQALSETQKKPLVEPAMTAGSGAEPRLVFVLRMSLDENRQPKRIEIEENQTRKKESFPGLNSERLIGFIQTFLSPTSLGETQLPAHVPDPVKKIEETERRAKIVVSKVEVENPPDVFNKLIVNPEQLVQVLVHYSVYELEALGEARPGDVFEIKLYSRSMQDSAYQLLAYHQMSAMPEIVQYSAELELRNLLPGLYNLFTVVSHPTAKIAGFFEGPVFEVLNPRIKEIVLPEDHKEHLSNPN